MERDSNEINVITETTEGVKPGKKLTKLLTELFERHFRRNDSVLELGDYRQQNYWLKALEIRIAIESLYEILPEDIKNNFFTRPGELNDEKINEEFISKKPLGKIKICVIGGLEGRIFAELGAQVIVFDPKIGSVFKSNQHPDLEEIPFRFEEVLDRYSNEFNLVYSSRVFSIGSGLVSIEDYPNEEEYHNKVQDLFFKSFRLLKSNGLALHTGDLIPLILKSPLPDKVKKVRIFITGREKREDYPGNIFLFYI